MCNGFITILIIGYITLSVYIGVRAYNNTIELKTELNTLREQSKAVDIFLLKRMDEMKRTY